MDGRDQHLNKEDIMTSHEEQIESAMILILSMLFAFFCLLAAAYVQVAL